MWKKKRALLHSRSRSQWCLKMFAFFFSRWYLLNCLTFCKQTGYGDASSRAWVLCKKIGLLSSKSRSQQGLIWSKYDLLCLLDCWSFCYQTWFVDNIVISCNVLWRKLIAVLKARSQQNFKNLMINIFWRAEPFTTKIGMVMHYHGPKDWFAVFKFKVKVSVKDHIIKVLLSNISSALLLLFQPNLVLWHIIISWSVLCKKMDCCFQGQCYREGLQLHWIFMYLISSVPLISWQQPNWVC